MAISNTKLPQTNKPLSLPLLAFITMIFLMLLNRVNSADSLSFTFNKFDPDQEDLIRQGDATIESSTKVLQLTNTDGNDNQVGSGRALFSAPLQLWGSSAVVASFDTTFTFVISSSPSKKPPDDVLTFFIASNDTYPNVDQFVAVEFDTYPTVDNGDPPYEHIGIHVTSRLSKYCWWRWQDKKTATAYISYNSASTTLSVVSIYPDGENVTCTYNNLDLHTVLPDWDRVGFYGSTNQLNQIINIRSWSFGSSVKSNKVQREDICIASEVNAAT